MLDRILSYLEKAGKPVPAAQILQDVLNVRSPNEIAADRVLKGVVGKDRRFRNIRGLWFMRRIRAGSSRAIFGNAAVLFLQAGSQPGYLRGALHLAASDAAWEFESGEASARTSFRVLRDARSQLNNRLLLAWSPMELRLWNSMLRSLRLEEWQDEFFCLRRLAGRILERSTHGMHPEDLASELQLPPPDPNMPARMARFLSSCLPLLLARVPEEHRRNPESLEAWIEAANPKVDFSRFAFGPEFLNDIPDSPGVYIMRNRAEDIVYIGKARNLRRRVRSYFTSRALKDAKITRIHEQLHSLEVVVTRSEVEALLTEMRLIRDFRPPINLQVEIHEQSGTYGKEQNLLLLIPHESEEKVEVYFLRAGCFVAQRSVLLGRAPSKKTLQKIRSVYFTRRHIRIQDREPWEVELVFRWLAANRKRLNFLDVDDAGRFEAVSERLTSYLNDPSGLTEKVYYR
jgi:predicted GIY-YIG superfamily endonuclease